MSLLTAQEVTNLYLYGSKTKPTNGVDDSLIRSSSIEPTKETIDVNDYMQNGPGRFASPAFFEIVKLFFSSTTSGLAPGVYTEEELRSLVGTSQFNIVQQQWAYDDGKDDYAERVYVWNSVAYEIQDDARFVVAANGERTIENFTIVPFVHSDPDKRENFDFKTDDWVATLGNSLLEERVDPSGIGRKVVFEFSPDRTVVAEYGLADYQQDAAIALLANPLLLVGLYSKITTLTDQLFSSGATKFLHNGKPIVYGTLGNDSIIGTVTTTNVDLANQRYLKDYVTNGIYYVAGNGDDLITATAKSDILRGGLGNDNLDGKGGDDILEGGAGMDTYTINAGDGVDTVLDIDGSGVVRFGAMAVEGRSGVADGKDWAKLGNAWVDRKNGIVYVLEAQNDGSNNLLVWSNNGSGVRIKAWSDGKLGITSGENTQPAALLFDKTIKEKYPDYNDTLQGTAGNDLIQGFGGNDVIVGNEGDDRMEGGPGQDALFGKLGHDVGLGGADSDRVAGQEGNDRLFADTEYTIDEAIALGETQSGSGQRGDMLDGGPDNDLAIAGAGDDILMGGKGKDILIGLGGNDTIEGDDDFTGGDMDWNVERKTSSSGSSTVYVRDYNFPTTNVSPDVGGDDAIYGGAGNDWIFTQGGNDFVDAGADDDVVFGEGGNDFILGQGGSDSLIGDNLALDAALHGNDYLGGGSGADKIWGDGGADHLAGGAGDDKLMGDSDSIALPYQGSDVLDGGDGNDELYGYGGNDTLIGGLGSDQLYGGLGDDTYQGVESGDVIGDIGGKNIIILADTTGLSISPATVPDGFAVMSFNELQQVAGNAPVSAVWQADAQALRITLQNGDTLELSGGLYGMDAQLFFDQGSQSIDLEAWVSEYLHDDVTLSLSAISMNGQPATVAYSGTGADLLIGGDNNDTLSSYAGNDELQGKAGDDLLEGGSGDDILFGQDGSDTLHGSDGSDQLLGGTGDDRLDGDAGADVLIGEAGADTLYGGDGSDELQGGLDSDTLEGDAGDDNLFGQEGNDTLHGGSGNDVLSGNAGDDVYLFNLGGGYDTIWEEGDSNGDVLRFGTDIAPEDISAAKIGYDLVLHHANGVDQVTISNWYIDPAWRLMQFEFAGGTVWSADETGNRGLVNIRGTSGSDTLYGGALDETITGFGGNDILYGNEGNDNLIGGVGNDALYGGAGMNTYRFAAGDGNDIITTSSIYSDTLYFAADIVSSDIVVERVSDDLWLRHQNGLDSIKVAGWYSSQQQLKDVVFESDGTVWTNSVLNQMGITHGNAYTLNPGDGAKIIDDWGGDDSLTFGAGVNDTEIVISRAGQDLKFSHVNGSDSVTVKRWFNSVSNQIEAIQFAATGTVLTAAQHTTPFLTLTGTAGNDVIQGGNAYDETLAGLGGNDSLNGGDGRDTYLFNQGDGQDTITDTSFGGNFIIFGSGLLSQLSISTNASNDTVYAFGSDKVTVKAGSSSMTLKFISNGTAASETLNGGDYNDIVYGLDGNDSIDGSAGTDDLYGDAGNDTITGGDGFDWLYGGDGDDVLDGVRLSGVTDIETYGSDSMDNYVGGRGNDTLHGNSRDDRYYFNPGDGNDVIIEGAYFFNGYWYYSSFDELYFGAGIAWDDLQATKLNNDLIITVSAADSVTIKDWFVNGRSQVDFFRFADGGSRNATEMTRLANTFRGTEGDDVLTGNSTFDSVLYGEGGNDTLNGGNANDALYGGSGNDMLNGGSGHDEYFFARNDGQDVINDISGIDTVRFDASVSATEFSLSRNGNDLVLTLTVTGDKLTVKDYLNGNLSTYTVAGSNVVNYRNYALIESFVFAGGGSLPSSEAIQDNLLNIRGTENDDALNGTVWADVLFGAGGSDALYGFGDDDVLYGGAGNDTLAGGSGAVNLLYGQDGDDVLIGEGGVGFGHGYLHGGTGSDTYVFRSQASISIYDDAGTNDRIKFDDNTGLLSLGFQQWGNELSISVAGGGYITIPNHFQSDAYKVERLVFADGSVLGLRDVQVGTGAKDLLNGTAEDSILIGDSGNDTLDGGDGNDWLDGGLDHDMMTGGLGNDHYFVDSAKDTVTELIDQGIDTVFSLVTYTLESNVEYLVLAGSAKINGSGNALDNTLTGSGGANTLSGEAGNDWLDGKGGIDKMQGGEGDDTFVVDHAAETVTERASEGIDHVLSGATFTLPNNVENLTLTGALAIDGTGNKLNNALTGNDAANLLTGNAGNDTLDGLAGLDMLIGGKGGDAYILGSGYGIDTAIENDSTSGVIDVARFLPGISADQLWFRHAGNDLEVSIIGTPDKLIVKDWYLGSAYRIEQFKTAGGLTLQHSDVENLVTAMAALAMPGDGQTILPSDYELVLNPVITAFWL